MPCVTIVLAKTSTKCNNIIRSTYIILGLAQPWALQCVTPSQLGVAHIVIYLWKVNRMFAQ
jgi:hypothetical protein